MSTDQKQQIQSFETRAIEGKMNRPLGRTVVDVGRVTMLGDVEGAYCGHIITLISPSTMKLFDEKSKTQRN